MGAVAVKDEHHDATAFDEDEQSGGVTEEHEEDNGAKTEKEMEEGEEENGETTVSVSTHHAYSLTCLYKISY
jgi:hypothetical protein